MQYIGDAKSGRLVGTDQFGNRYFENLHAEEEIPGRHRWVDYAQHEYNGSQVPPEWHSWLTHIRQPPPTEDAVMQKLTPPWQTPYVENLTGTRGSYRTYNTTKPKVTAWEPKPMQRG
jgi:NADH dehydrogenase (ubiquinone) 1 alpha subcomplex subunit 12